MRKLLCMTMLCASCVPLAAQQPFRFAWLTDLHVGSETGEADLREVVDDINARRDLRFVIVSGDVTEMGTNGQVARAREVLDGLRVPLHLIPGNHDTKWSPSAGTYLPSLFGGDRFAFESGEICFIGLHQGPLMRMADGHWSPQDLRWLDTALARVGQRPLIFVSHYPLDSSICNWYEVLARLRGTSVQAALVGHGHTNLRTDFEGIPAVMSRAVIRDRARPPGYTIVECRDDSLVFAEARPGFSGERAWTSVPRQVEPYRGTPGARPDFSVNERWPAVRAVWRVATGFTIVSRPAVSGDLCIVGTAAGDVRALSLDRGVQRWSYATGGPVVSSPDTGKGLVVFGSADGGVCALEAVSGRLRWRCPSGQPVVGSPHVAGDQVYIGGSDGYVRALGLSDGRTIWRSDSIGGFVEARPAVTDSLVIVGAWDGMLYAFDRSTGTIRWRWHGEREGALYSPAACSPVIAGERVWFVAPDRAMTCLDLRTGRQLWRSRHHQVRESIGGSPDGAAVYVHTMSDSLVALDAREAAGSDRWTSRVGFGYDLNPAPPVVAESTLVYGTMKGLLCALDARTGSIRWLHRVGVSLVNPVVPLGEGRFLVADMDGMVQLVRAGEGQ